jgi:hypothetical protein
MASPYTVVGVMPKQHPGAASVRRALAARGLHGRAEVRRAPPQQQLREPGPAQARGHLEQARSQVDALNAANLERFPQYKELLINAGFHTVVTGWHDHLVKGVKTTFT